MFYLVFFGVLVLAFLGYLAYLFFRPHKDSHNVVSFKKILTEKGLEPDHFWSADNDRRCISINDEKKKFSYGYVKDNKIYTKEFDYSQIVSFEIEEDGETVYKNSLKGAVIGGAIAGGVGAIIGSQARKKGKTVIKSIILKIVVEDIKDPIINMPVLDSIDGYKSDGQMIAMARTIAERWDAIFKIILKNQNKVAE